MSRIAITGAAGFIGSNLADRLLTEGHAVIGIDNLAYGLRDQVPPKVHFVETDIRNPRLADTLRGVDTIFHLAAKNCIPDCEGDPAEAASVNVQGTVNVFEAARRAGVKKIVYAETSALYEGCPSLPSHETDVAPRSFYAISKFAGAAFIKRYREHFGMRVTALRYFNVYGPRQDYRRTIPPVMSAFIIALLNNKRPIIYGSGSKRRDFVFVDDVNEFHVACLTDPRTDGHTFNIGSGRNYSVLELYEKIALMLGKRIPPEHRGDAPGDEAQETLANIDAARSLGWSPKVSLEDGLDRSIRFIKEKIVKEKIVPDPVSLYGSGEDPKI
jgi:nucleoside-diphosphate-sugar epimerase